MPTKENVVKLSSTGPSPEVELVIGYAQRGKYLIELYDPTSTKSEKIADGFTFDKKPRKWLINHAPTDLNGSSLSWAGYVAANDKDKEEHYSVTVRISQAGTIVQDGEIVVDGTFKGTKSFWEYVRFSI